MIKKYRNVHKNKKRRYCCFEFGEAIRGNPYLGDPPFVTYTPRTRTYGVASSKDPKNYWRLHYCPFCGKPLPSSLEEEYNKAVINPFTGRVFDPMPKEFESDRWWKKRGL